MTQVPPKKPASASWFDALGELALSCAGAFAEEEGAMLRRIFGLIDRAPSPSFLAGIVQPDAALFEAWVSLGATTSAAEALIGEDAGYMLSRDSDGNYLASIILPGRIEETTASADTAALAIVGALAIALHEVLPLPADCRDRATGLPLRLN